MKLALGILRGRAPVQTVIYMTHAGERFVTVSKARDIQMRLKALLAESRSERSEIQPHYLYVLEWIAYARQYSVAGGLLASHSLELAPPAMHLFGHAIECSLKACLHSKSKPVPRGPNGHDLVGLADRVIAAGFRLSEPELFSTVQVGQSHHIGLSTNRMYMSRYPDEKAYLMGGRNHFPGHLQLERLVENLCSQAESVNDALNRAAWHAQAL